MTKFKITQEILDYISKRSANFSEVTPSPTLGEEWTVNDIKTYPNINNGNSVVEAEREDGCYIRLPENIVKIYTIDKEQTGKFGLQEEPVSENLEDAMQHNAPDNIGIDDLLYWRNGFVTGANWKAEQFEKNRLAACYRQTEKEAEIERDFVMGIIEKEHRQPTFDDAIKYGMKKMKQQMMAKAIDGVITFDYYSGDNTYGCVAHDSFCLKDFGLKDRDEVKVIVIKEE